MSVGVSRQQNRQICAHLPAIEELKGWSTTCSMCNTYKSVTAGFHVAGWLFVFEHTFEHLYSTISCQEVKTGK